METAALAGMRGRELLQGLNATTARIGDLINRFPATSYQCRELARQIADTLRAFGSQWGQQLSPQLVEMTVPNNPGNVNFIVGQGGRTITQNGIHYVTQLGNRIYHAITGPQGLTIAEYTAYWAELGYNIHLENIPW